MSVIVRPVRPDEHVRAGQIVLAAYDAVGTIEGSYREFMADTGRRVADGTPVWVAELDGQVVGTVTFSDVGSAHFEHDGHGDCGFRLLGVDPAAQGRGVGRALVQACIDEARARDRVRMAIYTMAWMPTAQAMYASLGFVRRPDRDVMFPAGVGLALQLDLDRVRAADGRFPPPGPVPAEPPWYEDVMSA